MCHIGTIRKYCLVIKIKIKTVLIQSVSGIQELSEIVLIGINTCCYSPYQNRK